MKIKSILLLPLLLASCKSYNGFQKHAEYELKEITPVVYSDAYIASGFTRASSTYSLNPDAMAEDIQYEAFREWSFKVNEVEGETPIGRYMGDNYDLGYPGISDRFEKTSGPVSHYASNIGEFFTSPIVTTIAVPIGYLATPFIEGYFADKAAEVLAEQEE